MKIENIKNIDLRNRCKELCESSKSFKNWFSSSKKESQVENYIKSPSLESDLMYDDALLEIKESKNPNFNSTASDLISNFVKELFCYLSFDQKQMVIKVLTDITASSRISEKKRLEMEFNNAKNNYEKFLKDYCQTVSSVENEDVKDNKKFDSSEAIDVEFIEVLD